MSKSRDAFRTISEVSEALDTPAHVLRFWESKFTQVKPVKRAGGRRYYRPNDVNLIAGIKQLLHNDGMTIKGAQKLLREKGVKSVAAMGAAALEGGEAAMVDVTPAEAPKPAPELAPEPVGEAAVEPEPTEETAPAPVEPEAAEKAAPTPVETQTPKPEPALTLDLAPKAAPEEPETSEPEPAKSAEAWRSIPDDPADSSSKAPARLFHLIQTAPPERLAQKAEQIAPLLDRINVLRDRITAR